MPRLATSVPALALAAVGMLACDSSAPSSAPAGRPEGGIQFTVGSSFPPVAPAVRGNAGSFRIHTNYEQFNVQLHAQDDADLVLVNVIGAAGGHSGWHFHPGPAFVMVKTGALTVYSADDPLCQGTVYPAGKVFVEGTTPHIVRNEGSVPAEFSVVFLVPAGTPQRLDALDPGTCPF
jgi:quercetin dioxygenase-like cupin family protein